MDFDVIIIGAGMSGLTAANYLHGHDLKIKIFEAEPEVGGRVRSFVKNGFILDRGFQVFLPAYPEASRLLNYDDLDLKYFLNGAYILNRRKSYYLIDPIQRPSFLFNTLFKSGVSLKDKIKLFQLKQSLKNKSLDSVLKGNNRNTRQELARRKFDLKTITDFFQPFLSGIFLEKNLETNSAMFEFVIKMFNEYGAAVPAKGIAEIPKQLARNLTPGMIECSSRVKDIEKNKITLENGKSYSSRNIVIAIEGSSHLLDPFLPNRNSKYVSVSNYYFSSDKALIDEPILILNSDESALINNMCFISNVSGKYTPENKKLLSVTVLNKLETKVEDVIAELNNIMPDNEFNWQFIDSYHINYALPKQEKVKSSIPIKELNPKEGIYIAGDFALYGSLNSAMQSGREVADQLLKDLSLID
ncbi:FAD-dependent oxidoreductase [Hyphobacterium sp. CCMP332]|nr:FAD-dependent oxidoreductase [Hyphobacterium sp. CCMP332]